MTSVGHESEQPNPWPRASRGTYARRRSTRCNAGSIHSFSQTAVDRSVAAFGKSSTHDFEVKKPPLRGSNLQHQNPESLSILASGFRSLADEEGTWDTNDNPPWFQLFDAMIQQLNSNLQRGSRNGSHCGIRHTVIASSFVSVKGIIVKAEIALFWSPVSPQKGIQNSHTHSWVRPAWIVARCQKSCKSSGDWVKCYVSETNFECSIEILCRSVVFQHCPMRTHL